MIAQAKTIAQHLGAIPEARAACSCRTSSCSDVRNEKVTLEHARLEHGVVIDPRTLEVDADATGETRRAARG